MPIQTSYLRVPFLFWVALSASCISYEPTLLVPALTLSGENISLTSNSTSSSALDFGLQTSVNESDSLTNIETLPGVRVRTVSTNGAADSAGIQPGDIILKVNELETNHPDVLSALQEQASESPQYSFVVRRNTTVFEATVVAREIAGNSPPRELYRSDPIASRAGYRTKLLNIDGKPGLAAAQLVEIFAESPLLDANITQGDIVLAVNGVNINSAQDLINRLNQEHKLGESVVFTLFDDEEIMKKTVRLWDPGRRISGVSLGPLLQYQSTLNPPGKKLSILDFWLFSIYQYQQVDGERSHRFIGLFNISSDYGELTEESRSQK